MIKCVFCERDIVYEDQHPVLHSDPICFGVFGKGRICMYIRNKIGQNSGATMDLRINLDGVGMRDIIASYEIDYCPKCGRKLTTKEDVNHDKRKKTSASAPRKTEGMCRPRTRTKSSKVWETY